MQKMPLAKALRLWEDTYLEVFIFWQYESICGVINPETRDADSWHWLTLASSVYKKEKIGHIGSVLYII